MHDHVLMFYFFFFVKGLEFHSLKSLPSFEVEKLISLYSLMDSNVNRIIPKMCEIDTPIHLKLYTDIK